MWFSLFALVLILAITFYQGLQGLFTALITCILTVLSAALAFGVYEDIYFAYLVDRQPDYGLAISLMAVFLVTLLVLRTLFDSLIKGNLEFPVYVDRAGGGLFGFVTAMVTVGMLTIGFQLLPFPPTFLGFARFTPVSESGEEIPADQDLAELDYSKVRQERHAIWLEPGSFTVSLVKHLSSNALQGRNRLADYHPDLLAAAHRSRANPLGRTNLVAPPDAIKALGYWDLGPGEFFVRKRLEGEKKRIQLLPAREQPDAGFKRIAVRVKLDDAAKDKDNTYRFLPEQVRLVVPDKSGTMKDYHLVGLSDQQHPNRIVEVYPGEGIWRQPEKGDQPFDFAFVVPDDIQFREGSFIEFKQNARAEITPALDKNKERPAPIGTSEKQPKQQNRRPQGENTTGDDDAQQSTPPPDGGSSQGNTIKPDSSDQASQQGYGRVSVLGPPREVVISDEMPFTASNYGGQVEAAGGEIRSARHMIVELNDDWEPVAGDKAALERFQVPEGRRMLQVSVERLRAGSTLGRAMQFAIANIGDFYLKTEGGTDYRPVGVYAMAQVGPKKVFELILLEESERDFARIPKLERIKPDNLEGKYALVYLFVVPPGTKPTAVHTGRREVDLRPLNVTVE